MWTNKGIGRGALGAMRERDVGARSHIRAHCVSLEHPHLGKRLQRGSARGRVCVCVLCVCVCIREP